MPKVSVIIPVYKVENYIEQCARSLFEQTLDDIEYLFIDDCSPDRSIDILRMIIEEYPHRKSQVIIHRMEHNSGLAAVRKWGILNSSGDYVIHCDSDDWIDVDAYEQCYNKAINECLDVVFFDFDRTDGKTGFHIHRNPIINNKNKLISTLISGTLMGSLCGALIKRSLYSDKIIFAKGNYNEDLVLTIQLIYYSNSFGYLPCAFYHYRVNPDSITSKSDVNKALSCFKQAKENINCIECFLRYQNILKNFIKEIECVKFSRLCLLSPYINDEYAKRLWKHSFPSAFWRGLFNPYVRKDFKIIHVLSLLGLFPLIYKIRHRKCK